MPVNTRNAELRRRAGIPPHDTTSEVMVSDTGYGVKVRFDRFPPSPHSKTETKTKSKPATTTTTKRKPNLRVRIVDPEDNVPGWLRMGPDDDPNSPQNQIPDDDPYFLFSGPLTPIEDEDMEMPPLDSSSPNGTSEGASSTSLVPLTQSSSTTNGDATESHPGHQVATSSVPQTPRRTPPHQMPRPVIPSPVRTPLTRARAMANISVEFQANENTDPSNDGLVTILRVPQNTIAPRAPFQDITNARAGAIPQWQVTVAQRLAARIDRRVDDIMNQIRNNGEGHIPVPPWDGEDGMEDIKIEDGIKSEDDEDDFSSTTSSERLWRAYGSRTPSPYFEDEMDEDDEGDNEDGGRDWDNISATSSELMEELGDSRDNCYFVKAYAYEEDGTPIINPETDEHIVVHVSRRLPPLPECHPQQFGPEGTVLDLEYEAPLRSYVDALNGSTSVSVLDDREGSYTYRRFKTEPA